MVLGSMSFVQYCISWSSIALLYYDYTLTFRMEVKYIWGGRKRLSTFICDTWYKIIDALAVFGRASVIVSSILKTYAVFSRNRKVLYLAILGLAIVITDSMHMFSRKCNHSEATPIVSVLRSLLTIIFETSTAVLMNFRIGKFLQPNSGSSLMRYIHQNIATFVLKLIAPHAKCYTALLTISMREMAEVDFDRPSERTESHQLSDWIGQEDSHEFSNRMRQEDSLGSGERMAQEDIHGSGSEGVEENPIHRRPMPLSQSISLGVDVDLLRRF
ncbi:hypothetical protein L218DRAFT_950350 [Marasmius fiardii PR-910]|nr:hypothetical protein L218DRAFT_950350 [Marasmius fiardii PR-910]